jgi:excisionase family DNA binding protein
MSSEQDDLNQSNSGLKDRLLSPTEVATYLGVPKKTLYAWRYRRRGPTAIKVGRHLRYRPSEVLKWLTDQPQGNDR